MPQGRPHPLPPRCQPRGHSRCQPRAPSPNAPTGESQTSGWREEPGGSDLMDPAHLLLPPGALPAPRGGPTAARGGCHPRRGTPGAAGPPGCGKLSKRADGAGSGGGRRRRAEKAIFSRSIFYKSNILCVSALPVKASRPQPRDSAAEPVSQQRLAATWLLAGGQAGRRGPPHTGALWGVPPDLSVSGTQPGHKSARCHRRIHPTGVAQGGGWAHTHPPCCSPAALHSWKLNIPAEHRQ